MKKSELKKLIAEVVQEQMFGGTTKQILAGLRGKTVIAAEEHPDRSVTLTFKDYGKIHFDRYNAFTPDNGLE